MFIGTADLVVVIEGKRTEPGPTAATKWMAGRHQMLRHLDCAWEMAAKRKVVGFFIVEGVGGRPQVPEAWIEHAGRALSPEAVASSLPHRRPGHRKGIAASFAGVTTWRRLCDEFEIDWDALPDEL